MLVFSEQRSDKSEGAHQVSVLGVKSQLQRVAAHAAILVLLENLDSTKCGIARGWVSGLTRNLEHGLPQVCFHHRVYIKRIFTDHGAAVDRKQRLLL